MAVISITYDEGNKKDLKYKSVNLSHRVGREVFDTGDFVQDWYDCNKYIINNDIDAGEHISHSSSVDHFIMDGAKFTSAYLHVENKKPILKYAGPDFDVVKDRALYENGIEFFVEENTTPTWEELKDRCLKFKHVKK